jgi:hypothetical protein
VELLPIALGGESPQPIADQTELFDVGDLTKLYDELTR